MAFKKPTSSKASDVYSKFKKKSSTVLDKIYEDREKRSSSGGAGKSIFDEEKLQEFGIEEMKLTKAGEYYFNILPQSSGEKDPYLEVLSIHYGCGINNDQFICTDNCFRCSEQKKGWKKYDPVPPHIKAQLVRMYPQDRVIYLVEDLTQKFLQDKDADPVIKYINAPKKGFHAKLQVKVRDKLTQKVLDISDVNPEKGTEGRIVYVNTTVKKVINEKTNKEEIYPEYDLELMERPDPVNPEILEMLANLIDAAEAEKKMGIQYLLHYPTEAEIKESMATEVFEENKPSTSKTEDRVDESEEKPDVDKLIEELDGCATKFNVKRFLDKHGLSEHYEPTMTRDELVEKIVAVLTEDIPF